MRGGSGDGNPIGIGVRKSIFPPCAVFGRALFRVRLSGALEDMLEHLPDGET